MDYFKADHDTVIYRNNAHYFYSVDFSDFSINYLVFPSPRKDNQIYIGCRGVKLYATHLG